MTTSRAWSGKALLVVAAWGISFVATRVALVTFTPVALVAARMVAGSAVLVALTMVRRESVLPPREGWALCLCLGLIAAAHLLIQAIGLTYTTAINTAWIIGFIPVTIALGARLFLNQRLETLGWMGVAIATGGVLVVTMQKLPDFTQARFGDVLQLASCLTWTAYTLLAVRPVARHGALPMTTAPMIVAAVLLTLAVGGGGRITVGPLTAPSVVALVFLGFVCSGLAYYLWFRALDEHGPARTGAYLYLEPFVTLTVAWLLLGEPITFRTLLGGGTVLLGVYFVTTGSRH